MVSQFTGIAFLSLVGRDSSFFRSHELVTASLCSFDPVTPISAIASSCSCPVAQYESTDHEESTNHESLSPFCDNKHWSILQILYLIRTTNNELTTIRMCVHFSWDEQELKNISARYNYRNSIPRNPAAWSTLSLHCTAVSWTMSFSLNASHVHLFAIASFSGEPIVLFQFNTCNRIILGGLIWSNRDDESDLVRRACPRYTQDQRLWNKNGV
jgi:hypothetical protein